MTTLFDPVALGAISAPNRIAMAPLTRNRSPRAVPGDMVAEYYAQRASAGLIVSEGTAISHQGQGYADVPGLYAPEQLAAWRRVTDRVHAAGGRIVTQLWHVGRVSHRSLQPGGTDPVAPSAIPARTKTYLIDADGSGGFAETSTPRALELSEIPGILDDFRRAAKAAVEEAGFDGVEIHAANGYLVDQFLRSGSNRRTDAYGGSVENRARFSPVTPANDASDPEPQPLFEHVAQGLGGRRLAYVHVIEGATGGARDHRQGERDFDYAAFKAAYREAGGEGAWMVNNGYDAEMAKRAVESGAADLVAFGRLYIANPDLVERLKKGLPLNAPDRATFYGGTGKGYTDYPFAA
jgi:N-ethylmaleimide reductase